MAVCCRKLRRLVTAAATAPGTASAAVSAAVVWLEQISTRRSLFTGKP